MHSLHARIAEFLSGWGGGGSLTAREQPGQRFFCLLILVLNLFYSVQRGTNGFITEKTILFKGSRGPTFLGGEG